MIWNEIVKVKTCKCHTALAPKFSVAAVAVAVAVAGVAGHG